MQLVQKDITTVTEGVIVHQVNCLGVMGAGVAKQIAKKFPGVEKAYKDKISNDATHILDKIRLLGTCHIIDTYNNEERFSLIHEDSGLYVANLFGQLEVGKGRQTDYCAVDIGLSMIEDIVGASTLPVYFPMGMGCGLGGGDWSIIQP